MEKSYKSNILKVYIFSFILGIHTVRGVYIPFMTTWGGSFLFPNNDFTELFYNYDCSF